MWKIEIKRFVENLLKIIRNEWEHEEYKKNASILIFHEQNNNATIMPAMAAIQYNGI